MSKAILIFRDDLTLAARIDLASSGMTAIYLDEGAEARIQEFWNSRNSAPFLIRKEESDGETRLTSFMETAFGSPGFPQALFEELAAAGLRASLTTAAHADLLDLLKDKAADYPDRSVMTNTVLALSEEEAATLLAERS